MITFRDWLGALLALACTLPVFANDAAFQQALRNERERPVAPRFERGDFLVRSPIANATLSPDGTRFAFLRGVDDRRGLWLMTKGEPGRQLLSSSDASDLGWTRDGRWLLVVSPRRLYAVAVDGQGGSRLLVELGGAQERAFMEIDPSRPASVLVRERATTQAGGAGSWRLLRIDIDSRQEPLAEAPERIVGYAAGRDGQPRFLQVMHGDALVTWRLDSDGTRHEVLRCTEMHRCALWPLTDREGRVLLVGDVHGSHRRLQRLEANGSVVDLPEENSADGELDEIAADPSSGMPLLMRFAGSTMHYRGTDAATQRHVDAVERRYPSRGLQIQPGLAQWLIVERGGAQQGARYHLYDPVRGRFSDVLDDPPHRAREEVAARWLPEAAMARQLPFSWTASDGMRLHGFVRVPPGVDPAHVPLVALVHGGPWANVAAEDFGSGYAQFLVNRGYAVFEPNFRGSTGFGRDYMLAANGDFGNGRVQADIVEGVRALLAAGVGDSGRVGIVGASFGGYSTLLGLTWQPDLFRVGVALVPPPDFAWDLAWIARTREAEALSSRIPFERWMDLMGLGLDDASRMNRLHAQSPLANATRMTRPLTIVAGGEDQRVALRGVLGYAALLKVLDRDVTLLVDPVAGHTNDRAVAREAAMYILGSTLHRYLGGAAETPPDPTLRDYLAENLRLGGEGLTTAASTSPSRSAKADP